MDNRLTVTPEDFVLRIFIDANVLIDISEKWNKNKSMDLFEELKELKEEQCIQAITSEYALWEFYGHMREEKYIGKMVNEKGWGFIHANKCSKELRDMEYCKVEEIGREIEESWNEIKEIVFLERALVSYPFEVTELVEKFIKLSKLSYRDAIILSSAIYSRCKIIVTRDDYLSRAEHIENLLNAFKEIPYINNLLAEINIKKPVDLINLWKVYSKWQKDKLENRAIAKISEYWKKTGILGIEVLNGFLKEKDYVRVYKAIMIGDTGEIIIFDFKVEKGLLRNFDTEKEISKVNKGEKATLKIPDEIYRKYPYLKRNGYNLRGGKVFLIE